MAVSIVNSNEKQARRSLSGPLNNAHSRSGRALACMIGSPNYPEASGGGVVLPAESQSPHVTLAGLAGAAPQRRGSGGLCQHVALLSECDC